MKNLKTVEEFSEFMYNFYIQCGREEALGTRLPFYEHLTKEPPTEHDIDQEFHDLMEQIKSQSSYPMYPLYKTLSSKLFNWIHSNEYPCSHVMLDNMNETDASLQEAVSQQVEKLRQLIVHSPSHTETVQPVSDEPSTSDNEVCELLLSLVSKLGKGDILKLLGFRKTLGSLELLPPDVGSLWKSYQALHHPKSKLTVGARALSKHCHRSLDNWWGTCTGSEENKNKHALQVLTQILLDIAWMNIHVLPHDVFVLEIRCKEGYGLRWSHDGKFFRGFLEPQIIDGHEKGWIH